MIRALLTCGCTWPLITGTNGLLEVSFLQGKERAIDSVEYFVPAQEAEQDPCVQACLQVSGADRAGGGQWDAGDLAGGAWGLGPKQRRYLNTPSGVKTTESLMDGSCWSPQQLQGLCAGAVWLKIIYIYISICIYAYM